MLIVSCSVAFWGFCGLGEWTGCPSTSQRWTVASPQQPYFNPLVPSSTPNIPTTLAKLSSFALVVRKGWWVTASLTFWFPLFYHALSLSFFSQPPHSLSLFSFHLSSLCSHSFCLVLSWKIEEHEWTADASCLERCLGLMQCVMCINSLHPLHPHPPHYLSHFAHSWSVIVSLFWLAIFFFLHEAS